MLTAPETFLSHSQRRRHVSATAAARPKTTTQQPEEVIVTGSRIRRVDTETPSPVQMVDRADIERTARQNISEVLRGSA